MAKKNISLENVINGKIKLFKDQNTDWNMKKQGLETILKKIDSLPLDIKQKELGQNCENLDEIVKMCKTNTKLKELAKTLDELLSPQSAKNITTQVNSKEPVKKENLNTSTIATTKKTITKTHNTVNTSTQKTNNQNDNIMKSMIENIIKQENTQISNKLTNIETKVKTLGEDLDHKAKQITKDTNAVKDTLEDLESIPKQINKLNDTINNIEVGTVKKSRNDLPKDVHAIEELTKFMKDGLEQFENIATYYVSNQKKLENAENQKKELDSQIVEEKAKAFNEGELKAKTDIVKAIFEKSPTAFSNIKDVFEDVLLEKYKENDKIEITSSDDERKFGIEIEGNLQEGKAYLIQKSAILIGKEVLIRAIAVECK